MPRSEPLAPPPAYAQLREQPLRRVRYPFGEEPWLLTRYADVRSALADSRFSSDARHPSLPRLHPLPPGPSRVSFAHMDAPDHPRLRRTLTSEFTHRRTQLLREDVQQVADALLDQMADKGAPIDLTSSYAMPLPSIVMCHLLGVPVEDQQFFQERSHTVSGAGASEAVQEAYRELYEYMDTLVGRKIENPQDDLLSRVAESALKAGDVTRHELTEMARILLIAGHETTASMIGLSVVTLLRNPDQLGLLKKDPSLFPSAVDELLRFHSITLSGVVRVATEDMEIGGCPVSKGDGVAFSLLAANHDESVFAGAARLDVTRDASAHLAFGHGVHQCLGKPLAKLELDIALRSIFTRFPDLRLAVDFEDIRFRPDNRFIYGLYELPVAW